MIVHVEFRKAILPQELGRLVAFDHKVFAKADWFPRADWETYESYWLIVNNRKVGCCAFEHHVDFQDNLEDEAPKRNGSLYIATTGILPGVKGTGLGGLLKCLQISYARHNGFTRIVTNSRRSNLAMIRLNLKFGFKKLRTSTCDYYNDPPEPTVVMELTL
jgi:RimJ/RimL family protein N-acetyltransferase